MMIVVLRVVVHPPEQRLRVLAVPLDTILAEPGRDLPNGLRGNQVAPA
jgi:hypothetical protein